MADNTLMFPSPDALLSVEFVMELLADLSEANPGSARAKDPKAMTRVYRKHLAGLSELAARGAVDALIRGGTRGFPSVGQIREAAHEWNRRNRASPEYQLRHDANACQSCRQRFVEATRHRPMLERLDVGAVPGSIALVPAPAGTKLEDRWIFLETYWRDVCACHAPCVYEPTGTAWYGGKEADTMPIAKVPPNTQHRILDQLTRRRGSWKSNAPTKPLEGAVHETQALVAGGAR